MAAAPIEYSEIVREHFRTPRNSGVFPAGTPELLEGRAGERRQGREISLALRLDTEGRVMECRYQVYGCPATIALCSILSERLKGRRVGESARSAASLWLRSWDCRLPSGLRPCCWRTPWALPWRGTI